MTRRRLKMPSQYAKDIGVSAPRVSYLKKNKKLKMVGNKVDPDLSIRLHQERLAAQQRSPARRVKDFYDAKMAKLGYEKAAGQVVEVEKINRAWRESCIVVKNALLALGRRVAPLLAHKDWLEIQSVLDSKVIEILKSLAHPEHYPVEELEKDLHTTHPKEATT